MQKLRLLKSETAAIISCLGMLKDRIGSQGVSGSLKAKRVTRSVWGAGEDGEKKEGKKKRKEGLAIRT